MSYSTQTFLAHPRGRRRTWPWIVAIALVAVAAWSGSRALAGGFFGHGHGHGEWTDEDVAEHLERMTGFALTLVDATDDQRERVAAIVDGIAPELVAYREEAHTLGQALAEALHAEPPDPGAVESARTALLDLADRASARALSAATEALQVLTPEQRDRLRELHAEFAD